MTGPLGSLRGTGVSGNSITTFGGFPEEGKKNILYRTPGEYLPPNLQTALDACRLANALHCSQGGVGMRYILDVKIHESVDPELTLPIVDCMDDVVIDVTELLSRFPLEDQKIFKYWHNL